MVDLYTTGFGFTDEKFAEFICQTLEIKPKYLTKPKLIQGFDGKAA